MIGSAAGSGSVELRSGTARDLDSVVTIMNSAFDPAFGEAWTLAQCAGILPLTGVKLAIAEDEDRQPLGFSLHRTVADEAELLLIAVVREARNRGIGQRLLDRFISDAHHAHAHKVHLEVRENNPARAMYEAMGFRAVGRRKNYYSGADGTRFDALTFVKTLDVPHPGTL